MEGILMSLMPKHRALLARLEKTLLETSRHLGIIERQIEARAERMTITFRTQRRQSGGGGTSRWTRADERAFRENIAALALTRRTEIDALIRKLTRQESAIAAFRRRHGIEPCWRPEGNSLHHDD
jgi:AraC-like DNA-binding protein